MRGIYLVANLKSQRFCENLVYSIRSAGCALSIRIIHFGGKKINSAYLLSEAELLQATHFSAEAQKLIEAIQTVITDCPHGFLYRFLPLFGDWDEFIYSDNDVVALTNWERLFTYLPGYDLVHADEEYTTKGKYNYHKPAAVNNTFGEGALETAITAGHFVIRRNENIIQDIYKAIEWFRQHPDIPKKHDQALLHIASLLGDWKIINLCKPPHHWLSSWAGDYKNALAIIQAIQSAEQRTISHLHYSGSTPAGEQPVQELLFSNLSPTQRLKKLLFVALKFQSGLAFIQSKKKRAARHLKTFFKKNSG